MDSGLKAAIKNSKRELYPLIDKGLSDVDGSLEGVFGRLAAELRREGG